MKLSLDISDELLLSYADRSTVGFTAPVDEEGEKVELSDEELAQAKIKFALEDITSKVKQIVVRPAELDLKKAKMEELKEAVETVKSQVDEGATIAVEK